METKNQNVYPREFSRVDAYLDMEVRSISPGERGCVRSRMCSGLKGISPSSLPEIEDQQLGECMRIINAKLDAIMLLLSAEGKRVHSFQTFFVNISGSGIAFDSTESYEVNDLLELKMVLPTSPEVQMYIYGEVVRSEPQPGNRYRSSLKYTVIDEDIREKLVKFVFEKQREMLRKQRGL